MKQIVYVTGHRNPDTDSICSAIAYAAYKNEVENYNAVAVRLGEINRETKFVLDYFGVDKPEVLDTIQLRVEDINFEKISSITKDTSIGMALNLMKPNNLNSIPVIDENNRLTGIVTLSDIIESYIDAWDNTIISTKNTNIENIIDTLNAEEVFISKDNNFSGEILVLAMKKETMDNYINDGDIVICGDRPEVQKHALKKDISLMIVTSGLKIDKEVIDIAKERDISIILTPHDTFTTSRLIVQSISISHVMTSENIVHFFLEELVDDVKKIMSQTKFRSFPVLDDNNKVLGIISRYHLISSIRKKVILVDHNERGQSVKGLDDANILEIIDHHRVADVHTGTPIYFRNEPVGSTATIVASIFFENGRRPSKKIAGLLLAAIISDTLLFKSPTTTNKDKQMLKRLVRITGINEKTFAREMFKEGTSLEGKDIDEIISQDYKTFQINSNSIGIAQVYTMDPKSLEGFKDELLERMEEKRILDNHDTFMLLLTDIFKEASKVIIVGENIDLIGLALGEKMNDGTFFAKNVLSRKKQVVPPLTSALMNLD